MSEGKDGEEPTLQFRRMRCALCGKRGAHAQCTVCHHWFHDVPGYLPPGEEEFVAVPMRKRNRDGEQEYVLARRTCFDVWHAAARQKAWGGAPPGHIPVVKNVRHGGGASGESAGVGGVVVSQHSGGTISSLSGSEGGARSPVEATDGDAAGALAMLGDSPLPAVPVAAATGGAGYKGDESGDNECSTAEGNRPPPF